MARRIGFMCDLKLPWLNKTAEFVSENLLEEEIKIKLEEYLSFEIKSAINLRRTREILMNIWYHENEASSLLIPCAKELWSKYPYDSMAIHWGLMLVAYPVFTDFCRVIGKITEYQTELKLAQIKKNMADEWGERSTLFKSIDEMSATLRAFGIFVNVGRGQYRIIKHPITHEDICRFVACAAISAGTQEIYSYQEINDMDMLFPFEYQVQKESLLQDERFVFSNRGGELAVALR